MRWWQADEYYMDYLRELLKKRPSKNSAGTDQPCISSKVRTLLRSYVYIPMKGFRIPPKLTVSVTVALVTVYQVALLLVVDVVPTLQKMRAGVHEEFSYVLEGFGINLSDKRAEVIRIVKYYFWIVEVCYISAITTSCCFTLSMLMRSMVLHRENLLSLYRGDTGKVFNVQRRIRPSQSAIVSWMSFTGYQVAHVALGLSIQLLVFFMCFGLFAFLIVVPILHGRNLFLFKILETMWPFWLALVVVLMIQHVLARFLFLHKDGKTLSITNRRGLYIFTYLFFMFNVLIGSIVAVWRVGLTAVYNIIHFCRLDMSLLHRGVECFDPAYRCYVGFLLVEVSHSHPVMKAFCFLLLRSQDLGLSRGDRCKNEEEGIQLMSNLTLAKTARSRRVRARWHLAFTLLRNPILIASRKPEVCSVADLVSNGELNSSSQHSPDDNLTKSELCEKE